MSDVTYTPISPEEIALAKSVAHLVEIKSIQLAGTHAYCSLHGRARPSKIVLRQESRVVHIPSQHEFTVEVNYEFIANYLAQATPDDAPLFIGAQYDLTYQFDPANVVEEEILAYGRTYGIDYGWPYWREYVQAMLTRMGLPAFAIPVLPPRNMPFRPDATQTQTPRKTAFKKSVASKKRK